MLLQKVIEQKKTKAGEMIGLVGTHRGAGVTHTGLMIAFYFGEELGKKTAFLELNDHHDMSLLQSVYEWSKEDEISFSYHQITFYKNVTRNILAELRSEDYDCYILDFGAECKTIWDEFLRCGTKIVIGNQVDWNRVKLEQFMGYVQTIKGSNTWLHLIPYATQKTINKLRSELERLIYSVPLEVDPMILSKDTIRLFDELFH